MIRRLALVFLFLLVFVGAAIVTMPLSFVLERSSLEQLGLNWARASGTVLNGSVRGLSYGNQGIGDIDLRLRPAALVSGRVTYESRWSGAPGSGSAVLSAGRREIAVTDMSAVVQIENLVGLADDVRRTGGVASISDAEIRFADDACASARGRVATDVVSRAATAYGQSGTDLVGSLACDGPMLTIPLSGQADSGDVLEANVRVGLLEPSLFEAQVTTSNSDLATLLVLRGFQPISDTEFAYRRETQLRRN